MSTATAMRKNNVKKAGTEKVQIDPRAVVRTKKSKAPKEDLALIGMTNRLGGFRNEIRRRKPSD